MNIEFGNTIPAAFTICDNDGKIIYMNEKAAKFFEANGGYDLIGKSVYDCHNEKSKQIIKDLIDNEKEYIYSIEKKGKKKLIYQAPWYKNNKMSGLIELIIELPDKVPHFVRE